MPIKSAKKKIIIFDLDDTLIDTSRIRKGIVKLAENIGVSKKDALLARLKVRSSSKPFIINNYAAFLFPKNKQKRQALIKSFNRMFAVKGLYNYSGTPKFLESLSKKYILILLTYGDNKFQKRKIFQSGLSKFFKKIIISGDNTKLIPIMGLIRQYGTEMLFVDNAKSICDAACELGLPIIWVTSEKKGVAYFKNLEHRINKRLK